MINRATLTTASLAIIGAGLWSYAGARLANEGKFEFNPNPLGIKRSPYGQVIAMAFQAPVDKDWHGGIEIHDHSSHHVGHDHDSHDDHCNHEAEADSHSCHDDHCDHDHGAEVAHSHDHSAGETCDCGEDHGGAPSSSPSLIDRLEESVTARTNPLAPTEAHKFYLRREIENKLRFAYELDPSHYANYASLHLFLKEDSFGTHHLNEREKTRMMISLAESTIRYCLREHTDPRPALTASAAAYNILEIMIEAEPGTYTTEEVDKRLADLDFCLKRHFDLLDSTAKSGRWELVSPARQEEILQRGRFGVKLRDTAVTTITNRRAGKTNPSAGL